MYRRNGIAESEKPLRERLVERYVKHHDGVMRYFEGRNDLLVMNIVEGDGWNKLCGFLGRPLPDVPFPHKNRAKPRRKWYALWK